MNRMEKGLTIIGCIALPIPVIFIWRCYATEQRDSYYATFKEAKASQSWKGRWDIFQAQPGLVATTPLWSPYRFKP